MQIISDIDGNYSVPGAARTPPLVGEAGKDLMDPFLATG